MTKSLSPTNVQSLDARHVSTVMAELADHFGAPGSSFPVPPVPVSRSVRRNVFGTLPQTPSAGFEGTRLVTWAYNLPNPRRIQYVRMTGLYDWAFHGPGSLYPTFSREVLHKPKPPPGAFLDWVEVDELMLVYAACNKATKAEFHKCLVTAGKVRGHPEVFKYPTPCLIADHTEYPASSYEEMFHFLSSATPPTRDAILNQLYGGNADAEHMRGPIDSLKLSAFWGLMPDGDRRGFLDIVRPGIPGGLTGYVESLPSIGTPDPDPQPQPPARPDDPTPVPPTTPPPPTRPPGAPEMPPPKPQPPSDPEPGPVPVPGPGPVPGPAPTPTPGEEPDEANLPPLVPPFPDSRVIPGTWPERDVPHNLPRYPAIDPDPNAFSLGAQEANGYCYLDLFVLSSRPRMRSRLGCNPWGPSLASELLAEPGIWSPDSFEFSFGVRQLPTGGAAFVQAHVRVSPSGVKVRKLLACLTADCRVGMATADLAAMMSLQEAVMSDNTPTVFDQRPSSTGTRLTVGVTARLQKPAQNFSWNVFNTPTLALMLGLYESVRVESMDFKVTVSPGSENYLRCAIAPEGVVLHNADDWVAAPINATIYGSASGAVVGTFNLPKVHQFSREIRTRTTGNTSPTFHFYHEGAAKSSSLLTGTLVVTVAGQGILGHVNINNRVKNAGLLMMKESQRIANTLGYPVELPAPLADDGDGSDSDEESDAEEAPVASTSRTVPGAFKSAKSSVASIGPKAA